MKSRPRILSENWKFFVGRDDNNFFYESEDFSFDLVYSYCCNINSTERTFSQQMHKHAHYELHMVLDGSFCYETDDKKILEVKKGEFVVFAPGVNHRITSETPVFSKFVVTFHFSPKDTENGHFYTIAENRMQKPKVLTFTDEMYRFFEMIFKVATETPIDYATSFFFLICSFFVDMLRVIVEKKVIDKDLKYKDTRINDAIIFINTNISANLKVPDVSKYLHMSTRQFTKVFTEGVGIPPGTYIKNHRIKCMCNLLENSDLYINDIVNILDYPDSAALIKAFKREMGITPSRYRKNYKSQNKV